MTPLQVSPTRPVPRRGGSSGSCRPASDARRGWTRPSWSRRCARSLAQSGFSRATQRVAFVVSEANESRREDVMPSLKKHEFESRPRSREKGSTRSREYRGADLHLDLPCDISERPEGRAPKLLHVGRRPSALDQPAVDDPGPKGERVAWKTAPSSRRARQMTDDRPPLRRSPLEGRWMEGDPSTARGRSSAR
jgi:hypothetical protein